MLDHPPHARTGEDARLDPDLELETLVGAAADAGVLTFGVLADEEHVHRRVPGERGWDTFEQPSRSQVRPEVEPLAQRQQQAPEGDVVGDGGIADGPEQHGVVRARDVERVGGHHRAGLVVVARPPGQLAPRHVDAGCLDDLARLGDDLGARAVAGDDRDPVRHRETSVIVGIAERPSSARHESAATSFANASASESGASRTSCASRAPWKTSPAPSVLTTATSWAGASIVSRRRERGAAARAGRHDHEPGAGRERGLGRPELRVEAGRRRCVQRHPVEVEPVDRVAAVDRQPGLARGHRVADVVDVDPGGRAAELPRPLARVDVGGTREVHDRAAVASDQDGALRRAGFGHQHHLRDVDALVLEAGPDPPSHVVVAHGADEVRLDAESRERHGRGRGRPAACNDELRRDDAIVRAGMPRHREDRVERGETDADDVRHRAITVTISCGRYGTTIVPPSTSSSSPTSSSAFARSAESNGSASRTRATPRAPCAS